MRYLYFCLLLWPLLANAQAQPEKAQQLQQSFLHAWQGYYTYAAQHDELQPLAGEGASEFFDSFQLTALEAYPSLLLMGLNKEAAEAKKLLRENLRFDKKVSVSSGDFGPRALGALLSAYQLEKDPYWLQQAIDLANRLLPAFSSPTGMPYRLVSPGSRSVRDAVSTPNVVGGLLLEFGLLSRLTGNPLYFSKAKKAALALWEKRSPENLLGAQINVETGAWANRSTNGTAAISGYLGAALRCYLLLGDNDCRQIWQQGSQAVLQHLGVRNNGQLSIRHSLLHDLQRTDSLFQYSEPSFVALLALGNKTQDAQQLMLYCQNQADSLLLHGELKDLRRGLWTRPAYRLRPEQVEAAFQLYRYTANEAHRQYAWQVLQQIESRCRTEKGYAGLADRARATLLDQQPTHFLSRTLRYGYLLFAQHNWPLDQLLFSAHGQAFFVPQVE